MDASMFIVLLILAAILYMLAIAGRRPRRVIVPITVLEQEDADGDRAGCLALLFGVIALLLYLLMQG
jgi:hypothetical protein